MEHSGKPPLRRAMRLPAIALPPRVNPAIGIGHLRGGGFLCQRMCHQRCCGQRQADFFLTKQMRRFTRNQRGVQLRIGKRRAGRYLAQKLHIGGQAHDMGLHQRGIQPGQCLSAAVAMHDELGHHGVVKRG